MFKASSFLLIVSFFISIHTTLHGSKEPKDIAPTTKPSFPSPFPMQTNTFLEIALDFSTLLWARETPRLLNLLDRIFHPPYQSSSFKKHQGEPLFFHIPNSTKQNPSCYVTVQFQQVLSTPLHLSLSKRFPIVENITGLPSLRTSQVSTPSNSKAKPFPTKSNPQQEVWTPFANLPNHPLVSSIKTSKVFYSTLNQHLPPRETTSMFCPLTYQLCFSLEQI